MGAAGPTSPTENALLLEELTCSTAEPTGGTIKTSCPVVVASNPASHSKCAPLLGDSAGLCNGRAAHCTASSRQQLPANSLLHQASNSQPSHKGPNYCALQHVRPWGHLMWLMQVTYPGLCRAQAVRGAM